MNEQSSKGEAAHHKPSFIFCVRSAHSKDLPVKYKQNKDRGTAGEILLTTSATSKQEGFNSMDLLEWETMLFKIFTTLHFCAAHNLHTFNYQFQTAC